MSEIARYIDADELYRKVKEKTNPYGKPTLDYESGVKVLDMIKNQPTADVVEVVRCKDCKYWHEEGFDPLIEHHIGECRCSQWENDYFSNETSDNDFCSCGERRDT